jgi:hypothetical protein
MTDSNLLLQEAEKAILQLQKRNQKLLAFVRDISSYKIQSQYVWQAKELLKEIGENERP